MRIKQIGISLFLLTFISCVSKSKYDKLENEKATLEKQLEKKVETGEDKFNAIQAELAPRISGHVNFGDFGTSTYYPDYNVFIIYNTKENKAFVYANISQNDFSNFVTGISSQNKDLTGYKLHYASKLAYIHEY
ncbi:hypothetical protein [Maribacter aquivivus]|uniref:hypothetical protein n=1 Tax=Maribacter aquivivus TaxID=228958 RepID=UPI002495820B|nr:hypothetical protein [Maribacter aquivivus]